MLSKNQKYFFLVSGFLRLICKAYLIFKIRGKFDLIIHRSVRTPLREHKGVPLSGLWAPVM